MTEEQSIIIYKLKQNILKWLQEGHTHEELVDMFVEFHRKGFEDGWERALKQIIAKKKRKWF